jgi:polyisoprenoid-binding protein YceI
MRYGAAWVRPAPLFLLLSLGALAACHAPAPNAGLPASRPAAGSTGSSAPSDHAAQTRYVLDAQHCDVRVLVYRDGPMGHLGHNHVIAVHELTGSVAVASDPLSSAFDITFPVGSMGVDDAQQRAQEGTDFSSTVDEAAIAGTRDHMLGLSLLNSNQYPTVHLQSLQLHSADGGLQALTSITVRDTTARVEVPIAVWNVTGDELTVSGEFDLTHSQLGLTPYSIALGALRVAERMHVRYVLVAHRRQT